MNRVERRRRTTFTLFNQILTLIYIGRTCRPPLDLYVVCSYDVKDSTCWVEYDSNMMDIPLLLWLFNAISYDLLLYTHLYSNGKRSRKGSVSVVANSASDYDFKIGEHLSTTILVPAISATNQAENNDTPKGNEGGASVSSSDKTRGFQWVKTWICLHRRASENVINRVGTWYDVKLAWNRDYWWSLWPELRMVTFPGVPMMAKTALRQLVTLTEGGLFDHKL